MRRTVAVSLLVVLAAAVGLRLARADENDGMPVMQKPLKHPFLDGLVGSWDATSKGAFGPGKGTLRFTLGVGGTALVEDYASVSEPGGGARPMTIHSHAVVKVSDDGKTLTRWVFDDQSGGIRVMSGPLTETGWSINDKRFRGTLEKTATGLSLRYFMAESLVWSEEYARAKK